jgi:topoisomerase-4 subunit A
VRLVFEPRTSKIGQQELLSTLLAHTSLEASVPVNLVMIGRDGRPRQKSLPQVLGEWIEFRIETVTRRTRHRLGKVDERIHILEGRQLVLLNIDEVIRIIRESDEPKPALIARFGLTDRQAEDILEIRLRQLARLEAIRIEQELAKLRTEREQLDALLGSESALRRQLIREIEADAKQYGDARRTLIEEAARTVVEVKIPEEPVTVIVSERGWVRARQGHGHDWSQFTFKSGDAFYGAFEVMTTDQVFAVASNGRVHSVPVSTLPSARGDGVPITSFFELEPGARIEHVFGATAETGVLLSTRGGNGFLCQAADLVARNKAGRQFVTLDDGDAPIRPALFLPGMASVACLSGTGDRPRLLVFGLDELKVLKNGGRGTMLVDLDRNEALLQAIVFGSDGVVISGVGRGGKAMEETLTVRALGEYRGSRGRKGKVLEPRRKDPSLMLPRTLPRAGD